MARVEYLSRDDLAEEYEHLFDVDQDDPDDALLNVHRAMANNPRILEAWGEWVWAVYEETGDRRIRELAILAVANEVQSRYVWHQHAKLSMDAGVTREDMLAIADGTLDHFPSEERAVLEYAVALVTDGVDDDTHETLATFYQTDVIVAIIFLTSEYLQISKVIEAMSIELEDTFVGWRLRNLE